MRRKEVIVKWSNVRTLPNEARADVILKSGAHSQLVAFWAGWWSGFAMHLLDADDKTFVVIPPELRDKMIEHLPDRHDTAQPTYIPKPQKNRGKRVDHQVVDGDPLEIMEDQTLADAKYNGSNWEREGYAVNRRSIRRKTDPQNAIECPVCLELTAPSKLNKHLSEEHGVSHADEIAREQLRKMGLKNLTMVDCPLCKERMNDEDIWDHLSGIHFVSTQEGLRRRLGNN